MPARVALIGAGSYVFAPSTLHDLLIEHRLDGLELALVDPDVELAGHMARLAERMAADADVRVDAAPFEARRDGLPGADFVVTSAAVQGISRWRIDRDIARRHGLIEPVGELGGVGGLSYALRQVSLHLAICRDVEELCPAALLLNVSNPLPRIVTAITSFTKVRACGLCNAAFGGPRGYENLARLLDRPLDSFRAVSAGVNHFNWLLDIRDASTDADLYPAVREAVAAGRLDGQPISARCLLLYGWLPLSGDLHIAEFLPLDPDEMPRVDAAFHGTPGERMRRRETLARVARGHLPWEPLLEHRSWERPADIINAVITRTPLELPMLNVRNDSAMPELTPDDVVELPCTLDADGVITPRPVGPLPAPIAPLIAKTARVNTLAARAAATGQPALVHKAISADPTLADKSAARAAMTEMIAAHLDLLVEQFR